MLAMLVCATHWLSMHLYTLAYMSMHESCLLVCRPCFNTMKLHTIFCFLSCLFTFLLVCLLTCLLTSLSLCLPCISCLFALCLLHMLFASFPSIACLLVSCLCLCMYTHGARARFLRRKQKERECKHVDMSKVTMFNRFKSLVFPIWLCTLLNPSPSSPLTPLDGLY